MSRAIAVVSPSSLEPWSWETPWVTGIGGSETSHVEMCDRLKAAGYEVRSFCPTPDGEPSPAGVPYHKVEDFRPGDFKIVIDYRHLPLLDYPKVAGQSVWFVSQDTEYGAEATDERLARVDRYLCLCTTHSQYVQSRIPQTRGKVYITANGVRSAFIENMELSGGAVNPVTGDKVLLGPRKPHQLIYPSSPDRGLKLLLQNWFRIKERVPDAELYISYGLDNMKKIVEMMCGNDWRAAYMDELYALFEQPGIVFTGRVNQLELYKHWFESSIFLYTNDFPETYCSNMSDCMATGCWPIANNYWAVGERLEKTGCGDLFYGIPQKSKLVTAYMLEAAVKRLNGGVLGINRKTMAEKARRVFDWEKVADQWGKWVEEDLVK